MKKLELEVVKKTKKKVTFKIKEQTQRRVHFGKEGDWFRASNGLSLASRSDPELSHDGSILFVRGSSKGNDERELTCTPKEWKKIEQAVKEYNEHFADEKSKKVMHLSSGPIPGGLMVCGVTGLKIGATNLERQVTCKNCLKVMKTKEGENAAPDEQIIHAVLREGTTHCGIKVKGRETTNSWDETTCENCLKHSPKKIEKKEECPYKPKQVWENHQGEECRIVEISPKGDRLSWWNERMQNYENSSEIQASACLMKRMIIDENGNPVEPEEEKDKLYEISRRDPEGGHYVCESGGGIISSVGCAIGKWDREGRTCIGFLYEGEDVLRREAIRYLKKCNGKEVFNVVRLFIDDIIVVFPKKAVFRKLCN